MKNFGGVLQPPFFYAMQFLCFLCLARVSPKVFDILGENGKFIPCVHSKNGFFIQNYKIEKTPHG